jgi:hypothetical protein
MSNPKNPSQNCKAKVPCVIFDMRDLRANPLIYCVLWVVLYKTLVRITKGVIVKQKSREAERSECQGGLLRREERKGFIFEADNSRQFMRIWISMLATLKAQARDSYRDFDRREDIKNSSYFLCPLRVITMFFLALRKNLKNLNAPIPFVSLSLPRQDKLPRDKRRERNLQNSRKLFRTHNNQKK